jgi:superfamily II DNA/RNA helicase
MQILAEIGKWAEGSGIQSASFIGGANLKRQLEKLKKHPQIIVGTPGRMLELIRQKKLKMHEVKTIILDEGDQLLQPEHSGAIAQIIKSTLQDRQLLLFSATLHESAVQKAKTMMKDPALIQIKEEKAIKPVEHLYVVCEARDKVELLRKIARMEKVRALVFMKDRWDVSVVAEKLKFKGIAAGELHSDLRKEEREKAVRLFQNGKLQLLLATDVAARGLDIPTITHVVHFNLAENVSQYVHRSGRTGRLGSTTAGTVISLITPKEEAVLKKYAKERNLNVKKSSIIRGEIVEYTKNNRG